VRCRLLKWRRRWPGVVFWYRHCITDCVGVNGGVVQAAASSRGDGSSFRHVLEFHLVPLPSGISAGEDLVRLVVYDQNNQTVTQTSFTLLADDPDTTPNAPFGIRTEDGKGVVYTVRALPDRQSYQLKVDGVAYDQSRVTVLYQTTFVIYIAVAAYPY